MNGPVDVCVAAFGLSMIARYVLRKRRSLKRMRELRDFALRSENVAMLDQSLAGLREGWDSAPEIMSEAVVCATRLLRQASEINNGRNAAALMASAAVIGLRSSLMEHAELIAARDAKE